jgi:hypothetical protein
VCVDESSKQLTKEVSERSVMTAEVEAWTKARNDKKMIADCSLQLQTPG